MRFHDDEPIECYYDHVVEPGEPFLKYDGHYFCDEDCLGRYLVEHTDGIECGFVKTAADYEAEWGDYQYQRDKDRRLWDE